MTWAAEVSLEWDPNVETDLAGYCVYWGTATGQYDQKKCVDKAVTSTTIDWAFTEGTPYFFAATAFDTDNNESGYSNEVSWTYDATAPQTPVSLRRKLREIILDIIIEALSN